MMDGADLRCDGNAEASRRSPHQGLPVTYHADPAIRRSEGGKIMSDTSGSGMPPPHAAKGPTRFGGGRESMTRTGVNGKNSFLNPGLK